MQLNQKSTVPLSPLAEKMLAELASRAEQVEMNIVVVDAGSEVRELWKAHRMESCDSGCLFCEELRREQ